MIKRKNTQQVKAGSLLIGGGAPVSLQSMTNIPIEETESNIRQIHELESCGVDMVRLAIRTEKSASHLRAIAAAVKIPLVADIHFDYRIAIAAMEAGAAKIRINPGNIGEEWKVREVVAAAKSNGVPIRIGSMADRSTAKNTRTLQLKALWIRQWRISLYLKRRVLRILLFQ